MRDMDALGALDEPIPLREKLKRIHWVLRKRFDFIARIAVAVYDPSTDTLRTYLHSSGQDSPLELYEARLSEAGSLAAVRASGRARVINDMEVFSAGRREHTKRIAEQGYRSSYTMPMRVNGDFFGFLFMNSYRRGVFTEETLPELSVYGHLVIQLVTEELSAIRTLVATVQAARDITGYRDEETGGHIDRMSHYARLIVKRLAPKMGLNDDFVQHVFLFAPLHDVGKVGIPDAVLKKAGKLTEEETAVMRSHAEKGRRIIDDILRDFGLGSFQHVELLRHIAHYHHEAMDGSGYPEGLKGEEIPIEARIIAVADVFDALTSVRRYKPAWTNSEAFAMLQRLSGTKFDPDCVEALVESRDEIEALQRRFGRE